jgi:hypothetical protein
MELGVASEMARFRNPRYAPESLERRLSPSDFGLLAPPAEVGSGLLAQGDPEPSAPDEIIPIYTPEIPPDQVPPNPNDGSLELPPPPIDVLLPG